MQVAGKAYTQERNEMITLSLDEFGDFEGIKGDNNPIGIAGILYDDGGNITDTVNEKKRVEMFYRMCIASVRKQNGNDSDFSYPNALHSNGSRERDSRIVGPVKRKVNSAIGEFLKNATFEGKEILDKTLKRKGKYYVFGIIKSDRGMSMLSGNNANFLVNDEKGSNLYFHMASEVVNRMLFHNPLIPDIKSVSINIASRRSSDLSRNSAEAMEYYQQGYKEKQSTNSKVFFGVANADIYRPVISQEMIRSEKENIIIKDFSVKPIVYSANADNMEFLYFADSICTFLSNNIKGSTDSEKLTKIVNKANQIIDRTGSIIFGYDEIDLSFQKAWSLYENGDYYECLCVCYDSKLKSGGYSAYYQNWFEYIRNLIINNADESRLTRAVKGLHDTIMTNSYNQDRAVYILNTLEKMSGKVESLLDDTESRDIMYTLYDIGVSAYCHIGDSKRAIQYYNRCKKFASRVSVEQYLETLNKMSETLIDNFEWKKAKQIADDSVKYQEELLKMKNALPVYRKDNNMTSIGLAKAYSQKAQVYAFMKEKEALDFFKKALNIFENDSANYRITQSYLLHYYIDNGMKDEYINEARAYFGGNDGLREQFDFLMNESFKETPIFNYKYALYVFIRGVYAFRMEEMSDDFMEILYDIEGQIKKTEIDVKGEKNSSFEKLMGHPSEIIFKYLSLIALAKGDKDKANLFKRKINSCLDYKGAAINLIIMYGEVEILEAENNEKAYDAAKNAVMYMKNEFDSFKNIIIPDDYESCKKCLSEYMTFMFH